MVNCMENILTEDLAMYVRKAEEYGDADIKVMGKAMASILACSQRMGEEAALAFYALGKISRAFGAYAKGGSPSGDTWQDLSIYVAMIRARRAIDEPPDRMPNLTGSGRL